MFYSLSHLLLKKIFSFSISFFSFFSLWSVVSPSQLFFPHLLLSFLLLSSGPFLSSSFFFFFFSSLFLSSVQCCFSLLLLFLLSSHWFSFLFTGGSWWWMLVDHGWDLVRFWLIWWVLCLWLRLCLFRVSDFPENTYFLEMLFSGKENIFKCLVAF